MTNKAWGAIIRILIGAIPLFVVTGITSRAQATAIYVGIGEDRFANDVTRAVAAITPFIPGANISVARPANAVDYAADDPTPATILANLTAGVAKLRAGDVLIFHYAGHGLPVTDPGDAADPNVITTDPSNLCGCDVKANNADEQIGPAGNFTINANGTTAGTNVTDDQLTTVLSRIPAGADALVVLDSCFSGLAIHSNSAAAGDIGTLPLDFIATADAVHCAPGTSKFLPLFEQAFTTPGGYSPADTNRNGVLTLNELFSYTMQFAGPETPVFQDLTRAGNNTVAVLPEPYSLSLVLGPVILAVYRRRRAKCAPATPLPPALAEGAEAEPQNR